MFRNSRTISVKKFRNIGIGLLLLGVALLIYGFNGGDGAFRPLGGVFAFMGFVMILQANARGR